MKAIAPITRGTTTPHECAGVAQSLGAMALAVANKKHALLSSASTVIFALGVVRTFLLAFKQLSPNVWETWMILTHEGLLVDIFLTCRLSKSLTFCEFVSVNFKPWILITMGPWCQVAVFFPLLWAYSCFSTWF